MTLSRPAAPSALLFALWLTIGMPGLARTSFPDPIDDLPLAPAAGVETAVFAGGCFWGVEAVFEQVKGVIDVVSGYSGGSREEASYDLVSDGRTGHAESVRVTYDPSRVSYGRLLKVFFAVAHDPTQVNRQGPDVGPQYRSVIFYGGPGQRHVAARYIAQLDEARVFTRPIATDVVPLEAFYPAEAYHQDYAERHPDDLYILVHDRPKVYELRREYPELWSDRRR